jgi:peptidyl-prolyl cis-trans isomerase SurA
MHLSWKRKINFVLPLVLLPVLLTSAVRARAEIVERIVAIVNDEIITQTDIDKYATRLKTGGLNDDLLIPDDETRKAVLADRSKLLQKMIEERVIDSDVKKENLSIPIERVEQEIRSIAKRNNVSRDDLKAALKERGIDFAQYQDFIKTGLERQSLIEKEVTGKIKISEDDVLSTYSARHNDAPDQAYEYTLAHIYFLSQRGGEAAAESRAKEVLKKLSEGANFEKLAADASEDPAFEAGGLLGAFKSGELNSELETEVKKLTVGQITGVLPTRGGFHIVKVNKKKFITDPRTEKERDEIRADLYTKSYKKQFQSWLDQLRQDAFVRINTK